MADLVFFIKLYSFHLIARIPWLRRLFFQARSFDDDNRNIGNILAARYQAIGADIPYRQRMANREQKIFSQNGEDGLLLYIFSQVGVTNRTLVEFGIETGRECNSANLVLNFGWNGLLMDGSAKNVAKARAHYAEVNQQDGRNVVIKQAFVTAENINDELRNGTVEGEIDLLSVDVDGNDYWIWKAIEVINPRLVVIEYNASLGAERSITIAYDPAFTRFSRHRSGWYHGASLRALTSLGRQKGYGLVCVDSAGCNAFFLRDDIPMGELESITAADAFYPLPKRCRIIPHEAQFDIISDLPFVDVP